MYLPRPWSAFFVELCVCVCWGGRAAGYLRSAGSAGLSGKDALFST